MSRPESGLGSGGQNFWSSARSIAATETLVVSCIGSRACGDHKLDCLHALAVQQGLLCGAEPITLYKQKWAAQSSSASTPLPPYSMSE